MADTPRLRAVAEARRTYDTGVPCVRGHTAPRWVDTRRCVLCQRDADRARYARHNGGRPVQVGIGRKRIADEGQHP